MSTIYVEIRAAEGGADSRLLVREQVAVYAKYCDRKGLVALIMDDHPGQVTLEVTGKDMGPLLLEAGGHRWQHVSPTDKQGRVHTSTVTVAVLAPSPTMPPLKDSDVTEELFRRGTGAGGQNVNKTSTACRLVHLPTGLKVECCTERSQKQNRETAWRILTAKVQDLVGGQIQGDRSRLRKEQVGAGARGDKRRSIAVQRDQVVDHRTGRRTTYQRYAKGWLEDLQ